MARALSTVDPRYLASSDAIPLLHKSVHHSHDWVSTPDLLVLNRSSPACTACRRSFIVLFARSAFVSAHVSLSPTAGRRKLTICFLDQLPILPRQSLILLRIHSFKHLLDVLIPLPFETSILRLRSLRSSEAARLSCLACHCGNRVGKEAEIWFQISGLDASRFVDSHRGKVDGVM
jgi:hypothetical protein